MELRIKNMNFEMSSNGDMKIGGYINVTERNSEVLYSQKRSKYFVEVMKKGVFERALNKAIDNIPLLLEHRWDKKLASIKEGSLKLSEDQIGLKFEARLEDSEVYTRVKDGLINSCSFGFRVVKEKIQELNEKLEKRFVEEIELMEVSLVENPAYIGSLVETRSLTEDEKLDECLMAQEDVECRKDKDIEEDKEDEKSDSEEKSEESSEEETPVKEEKTDEKETDEEVEEEKESRNFDEITPVVEDKNIPKEDVVKIIDTVIEEKQTKLQHLETEEKILEQDKEFVKLENQAIEEHLDKVSMEHSLEIVKLRCEIIKLQEVKEGI